MFELQSQYEYKETIIIASQVSELIDSLKNNCTPGCDGVTRENLTYMYRKSHAFVRQLLLCYHVFYQHRLYHIIIIIQVLLLQF